MGSMRYDAGKPSPTTAPLPVRHAKSAHKPVAVKKAAKKGK